MSVYHAESDRLGLPSKAQQLSLRLGGMILDRLVYALPMSSHAATSVQYGWSMP